jgi:hypothetical protein
MVAKFTTVPTPPPVHAGGGFGFRPKAWAAALARAAQFLQQVGHIQNHVYFAVTGNGGT